MMKRFVNGRFVRYIGFIPQAKVASFFIGSIHDMERAPFPKALLERYVERGLLDIRQGVVERKKQLIQLSKLPRTGIKYVTHYECQRCQNNVQEKFVLYHCAKCGNMCVYCRQCLNMGRVASCTKLATWILPYKIKRKLLTSGKIAIILDEHVLTWDGELTVLQAKASQELANSLKSKKDHIVHAVCGAGKTELLFRPIYEALGRGERVCVATPRTDVVLELYPRFQQAFEKTNVQAYYGGAKHDGLFGSLILATTHQLYRFENAFDVIIVDEADAFPYTYDVSLQKAVQKAKKKNAPVALVSATPSRKILQLANKRLANYSFIPKRFHNFPLPVPRAEALWNYEKQLLKGKVPAKLASTLEKWMKASNPFLLFFPSIDFMEKAYESIYKLCPDVLYVHADDEKRKEKVVLLREGKVPGLLTTTILERGVTIKNVQVAVVGAENKIFDSAALIQIAGRVGRNANYPDGDVIFFHHGVTAEMDAAIAEIKRYNEIGFPKR